MDGEALVQVRGVDLDQLAREVVRLRHDLTRRVQRTGIVAVLIREDLEGRVVDGLEAPEIEDRILDRVVQCRIELVGKAGAPEAVFRYPRPGVGRIVVRVHIRGRGPGPAQDVAISA